MALRQRRGYWKAVVAIAAKNARMAWAVLTKGESFKLRFDVRDVPGSLADVASQLGKLGANLDQVQHQRAFTTLSVERARIEVVVQTCGAAYVEQILSTLRAQDCRVERIG